MKEMYEIIDRRGARIPCAMATQHPDSASKYVQVQEEEDEALKCLAPQDGGLGCDEYMVDYEGKLTPYHQVANIAIRLLDELKLVPGRDVFITPRIASAEQETVFRQFASILAAMDANYRTRQMGASVIEVIHPMTTTAAELVEVRKRIAAMEEITKLAGEGASRGIEVIPLFEEVPQQLSTKKTLSEYVERCDKDLGVKVPYLRVFIGKSDSALMYGHVPSALACKLAIADTYALGREVGKPVAPIFGGGALPFRGHVTLKNIRNVLREYAGVRTITVQSGIRYDHGPDVTRELVKILHRELQKGRPPEYSEDQQREITLICCIFSKHYISTLQRVATLVGQLSDVFPKQRDRLTQAGRTGYARKGPNTGKLAEICKSFLGRVGLAKELARLRVRKTELPRAITYTGLLYTISLPPEFIGTGRGLWELKKTDKNAFENLLEEYYPSLRADLEFAGRFLDLKGAKSFLPEIVIRDATRDVSLVRELLDIDFEPDEEYRVMANLISPYLSMMREKEALPADVTPLARNMLLKLGKMRGSLG